MPLEDDSNRFEIWHTNSADPVRDGIVISFDQLKQIVSEAEKAAELKKREFLKKRLDADLF